MTTITFFRSDGIFYGFEESGHVGYGEWGQDPFCAMLSSTTMFIVDAVEDVYHGTVQYNINEDDTVITVRSPSALPQFFSGLRIAAAYGVVGAVISEWLGGFAGLGVYMTRVKKAYAFDKMFAVIFLISGISLGLMTLVEYAEKKCMPYRHLDNKKGA